MAYILVIDDDALFRSVLRDTLIAAGHEVAVACDGKKGLKLYIQRPPALIITDIIMPEMDGIETIIELRRMDPLAKIIAVSAGSKRMPSFLGPAKLLGAARTFSKPVDLPELLAAVAELIADDAPPVAPQ
jgi:CheY-like chemotaxis protein